MLRNPVISRLFHCSIAHEILPVSYTHLDVYKRQAPYAVDVSSGIETDGWKDKIKMEQFVRAVRSATAMK